MQTQTTVKKKLGSSMLIILMTREISDFVMSIGTIGKQRAQKHSIIIMIIIIMLMIESVANYLEIK